MKTLALAATLVLAWPLNAAWAGPIDEVSVGGYMHDVTNLGGGVESNLQDVQIELDSARPSLLRPLGAPRVNVTVAFNGARKSDMASAGLVWDHRVIGRLYATFDVGLALTDGVINPQPGLANRNPYPRLLLGSSVLFREAPGLEWRIDDHWLMGAQFVHASNGGILGSHHYNRGINDAGLRLGYRFN